MKLKPDQELEAFELIKGLPLFAGCPEEALKAIASRLDGRDVLPGKVVLMDQEIGKTLYLLAKGSVGIWKRLGGEKKQLAVLKAPDFFGERSMFEESPASALVKSIDRCLIYALERTHFNEIAVQFPAIVELIKNNMAVIRTQRLGPVVTKKED